MTTQPDEHELSILASAKTVAGMAFARQTPDPAALWMHAWNMAEHLPAVIHRLRTRAEDATP